MLAEALWGGMASRGRLVTGPFPATERLATVDNRRSTPAEAQDARDGFQALRHYVRQRPPRERCDLCAAPVAEVHQHLLEPASRALVCACEACAILFSTPEAKYRRVPRRIRLLQNFHATDQLWEDLAIPINMAYFYHDSVAGRVQASYPSPAGATESLLPLDSWRDLVTANPILNTVEPDVEGLLVNRIAAANEHFLLPIDECFKLVGLIRTEWRGLAGGTAVWKELAIFFAALRDRALIVEASRA